MSIDEELKARETKFQQWLDKEWPIWRTHPDNLHISRMRKAWNAALATTVSVDDVKWLIKTINHTPFSHDLIGDEKRCERCKRMKKIQAKLAGSSP